MCCGVGCSCGSDLALLWLWCSPAAVAPIRSLAWERPYGADAALKSKKKKKKKRRCKILGPTSDLPNYNWHFNKIPRKNIGTPKLEKHRFGGPSDTSIFNRKSI